METDQQYQYKVVRTFEDLDSPQRVDEIGEFFNFQNSTNPTRFQKQANSSPIQLCIASVKQILSTKTSKHFYVFAFAPSENNKIISMLFLYQSAPHLCILQQACTYPTHRKKGLFKKLVQIAFKEASLIGCQYINLTTQNDYLLKTYVSLGFQNKEIAFKLVVCKQYQNTLAGLQFEYLDYEKNSQNEVIQKNNLKQFYRNFYAKSTDVFVAKKQGKIVGIFETFLNFRHANKRNNYASIESIFYQENYNPGDLILEIVKSFKKSQIQKYMNINAFVFMFSFKALDLLKNHTVIEYFNPNAYQPVFFSKKLN